MSFEQKDKAFWRGALWVALLSVYPLLVLLKTHFISDDAYESQLRGGLYLLNQSLFERITKTSLGWLLEAGRITLTTWWYRFPLFYFVQDVRLFKLINIGFVIFDLTLFALLIKRLTRSSSAGWLIGLLVPVFFQLRAWHDPLLAFVLVVPFQMSLITLSFLLFERSLDNDTGDFSARFFIGSLGFWLLSLCTGELSYSFVLVPFVIALLKGVNWRRSMPLGFPFVAMGVLLFGLMMLLKSPLNSHFTNYYAGVKPQLSLTRQWKTFLIQSWAAFPVSYYGRMMTPLKGFFKIWDLGYLALLWATASLFLFKASATKKVATVFAAIGLCYALLPVLPLTFSSTYQESIPQAGWGFGYIPVYIQYYGAFLLMAAGALKILSALQSRPQLLKFASAVAALPFVASAAINLPQNRSVALATQSFYTYPREVLSKALENGLLGEVPSHGVILHKRRFPSDHPWLIAQKSVHHVFSQEPSALFERQEAPPSARLDYESYKLRSLYLPESAVPKKEISPGVVRYDTSSLPLYGLSYQYDPQHGQQGLAFGARITAVVYDKELKLVSALESPSLELWEYPTRQQQKLESPISQTFDFLKIIQAHNDLPLTLSMWAPDRFLTSPLLLQWTGQFLEQEGPSENTLRWCGNQGSLSIVNTSQKPLSVTIKGNYFTSRPENSELWIQSRLISKKVILGSLPTAIELPILLPPGRSRIDFLSKGQRLSNGDPRNLVFGISHFQLKE